MFAHWHYSGDYLTFDEEFFFLFLLPPIIFQSGEDEAWGPGMSHIIHHMELVRFEPPYCHTSDMVQLTN